MRRVLWLRPIQVLLLRVLWLRSLQVLLLRVLWLRASSKFCCCACCGCAPPRSLLLRVL